MIRYILSISLVLALLVFPWSNRAEAKISPPQQAQVSFTFDDGTKGFMNAAPILASKGYAGTGYFATDFIGRDKYVTWDDIKLLKEKYNWEIASHTKSHPLLTQLSPSQLEEEVAGSKAALQAKGYDPKTFALPYGDYNNQVLAAAARQYAAVRPFHDVGYNTWPYNNYLVYVQQVQSGVTVNQVKRMIDEAKRSKRWLVLVFHDIQPNPSTNPEDYQYGTKQLQQIVDYVKQKNVAVRTVEKSLVTGSPNLLSNGSFEGGLTQGWSNDDATRFTLDTNNNGSYPSPKQSVQFTAGSKNAHLFSEKVKVNSTNTYALKSFLNVTKINNNATAVGYYVDEYDVNGNWLSGQYKVGENTSFVEEIGFTYKPTSSQVKQASLQFILPANSGATGYIDSFQWFALN